MTASFQTAQAFSASATLGAAKAGFAGLALVVTFGALAAVSQIADHQVDEVTLANAARFEVPAQVVVVVGKKLAATV